jgi:transposase
MLYVGVDQHKRYSHLTAVDEHGEVRKSCQLPNEREAFARVLEDLDEPCRSVVDAGPAWGVVYDLLEELGAQPVLAKPYQVRVIADAKVKTDRIDSGILAQLLRADLLPLAHVPCRETRYLKNVLRQRLFLVRVRTRVKNRIHALLDRNHATVPKFSDLFGRGGKRYLAALQLPAREGDLLRSHLALMDTLDTQIKDTERWLATSMKQDHRVSLLQTIPGLGPILAAVVALEIDDIGRFLVSSKLCAYAGLVPSVRASGGKAHYGQLIPHSNKHLRWAMVEAAWSAINTSPYCRACYDQLRRHKPANVAITAVARRLLEIAHALLTEGRPYQERPVPVRCAPAALHDC